MIKSKARARRLGRFVPRAERLECRIALSGGLDPTFGSSGRETIPINLGGDNNAIANTVAALPDGQILLAGGVGAAQPATATASGERAVVVRLNANGSLDPTFGAGGEAILPLPDPGSGFEVIKTMAVQPNGDIVVVGDAHGGIRTAIGVPIGVYPPESFFVARLLPNGSLDPSFGNGGQEFIGFNAGGYEGEMASGVSLQTNGQIVFFGTVESDFGDSRAAVARLNPNGSLDSSFGSGGEVMVNFGFHNTQGSSAVGGAIQPNGQIVIFGSSGSGGFYSAMAAARLNANGTIDPSFGSNGVATVAGSKRGDLIAYSGLLQSDGKIIIAGTQYISMGDVPFAAVRLNSNGTIDRGFHKSGIATANFNRGGLNGDEATGIAETSSGELVLGGMTWPKPPKYAAFGAVSLTTAGKVDKSFGKKGFDVIPFNLGGNNDDEAYAESIDSNGNILLAGYAATPNGDVMAVARLLD